MRFVIVTSTNGGVMGELLNNSFFRSCVHSVVSDRECSAIEIAVQHGIDTEIILENDKRTFCARLLEYLRENAIDYVIAFYTKLFVGELLEAYRYRMINLHPSLLPAFRGLRGLQASLEYGVRYIGSTIHFIDETVDKGNIIMQTIHPLDPGREERFLRHKIFEHQCKSLLQVTKWLVDKRIEIDEDGKVVVTGARFDDLEFSPCLDFPDAMQLAVPFRAEA
jgi:phosphoribosylglycinamide formyltransferase 1